MRLRVLVASDKQNGVSWWKRLWSGWKTSPPAVLPTPDARWESHGPYRFLQRGRFASRRNGDWTYEYSFSVLGESRLYELRMLLPEPLVDRWQSAWDQRMPQPSRYALARAELIAALDAGEFSATRLISAEAVMAVTPERAIGVSPPDGLPETLS